MIARIWAGATRTADAAAYQRYMDEVAMPGYSGVAGNQGVLMLRRDRGDDTSEFVMISLWDDMDAVRGFTGADPDAAVFYDRDDEFLVERDVEVRHYEVYGARLGETGQAE